MTPEQVAAVIVAVVEAVEGALTCIEQMEPNELVVGAEGCLRSARASAAALAQMADALLPSSEENLSDHGNTDDPVTCRHNPPYFELPGQTMCQSCGASRLEDGSWVVL